MVSVSRLWRGDTVVCIGGGPSLIPADVNAVRGRARVIAINDAYRLAPWADVLYACDARWWKWHGGVPSFTNPKFAIQHAPGFRDARWNALPDVTVLRNTGVDGLELAPTGLRTGRNSGYQAINLAVHLGAARILLLGYDMRRGSNGQAHWFGEHPHRMSSPYQEFRRAFTTLVDPLRTLGIDVVNCSRATALTAFPRLPLEEALQRCEVAA